MCFLLQAEPSSSERNLRVSCRCLRSDPVPRRTSMCFLSRCSSVFPVVALSLSRFIRWTLRYRDAGRQLFVLRFPGSGSLLQPRGARAALPQEAPRVLRGDVSRPMFPHLQREGGPSMYWWMDGLIDGCIDGRIDGCIDYFQVNRLGIVSVSEYMFIYI